jgi:integrase
LVNETYLLKNTNYEKDRQIKFSTIKFSNDLLNDKQPNQTKEWLKKAFGLLIRLAVKTGIRASDLLNLHSI